MRWTIKPQPQFVKGATRTLSRFAWFPTRLDTDQYVWLERYEVLQHVERVTSAWYPIPYLDWVTISKLPIVPDPTRRYIS